MGTYSRAQYSMPIRTQQLPPFLQKRLWHESVDRKKLSVQVKSFSLRENTTITDEKLDENLPPAPVLKPVSVASSLIPGL